MLLFCAGCDIISISSVLSSIWIEYQIPILAVAGSSPVGRAKKSVYARAQCPLAKLCFAVFAWQGLEAEHDAYP